MLDVVRSRDRDRLVDVQIVRRGVRDRHVLDAMRRVPREAFVEPGFEEFAYCPAVRKFLPCPPAR